MITNPTGEPRRTALLDAPRRILDSLGAGSARIRASLTTRSDHFDGRRFRNAEPDTPLSPAALAGLVKRLFGRGRDGRPSRRIPVERPDFPHAVASLAATWLGHASVLLEVDGCRILADPIVSDRASPADFAGPRRLHPPPIAVDDLPPIDVVLVSHDHYDHLDRATIAHLLASSSATFVVPLGLGAHLSAWGVPARRIVERDWGESHLVGSLQIVCTPARHFSGRAFRRNGTLWSSWSIVGPAHRVFFGGDTGFTSAFAEIGRDHGPFDLTVLPIGAYDDAWADIHMTPEQAAEAHADLGGAVLLPIHWATFNLAPHPWAEPIERLLRAVDTESVALARPGRRVVLDPPPAPDFWWR